MIPIGIETFPVNIVLIHTGIALIHTCIGLIPIGIVAIQVEIVPISIENALMQTAHGAVSAGEKSNQFSGECFCSSLSTTAAASSGIISS
jgi:hypothetical protein